MTFDQAAARALIGSYHPNFVLPYEIRELKAALAEIERLQAENERLMTPNACDDWGNPLVCSVSGSCEDVQAKRIAELESVLIDERKKYLKLLHPSASTLYYGAAARGQLASEYPDLLGNLTNMVADSEKEGKQ